MADPERDAGRRRSSVGEFVRHSIAVEKVDEQSIEGQMFSMNDVDPVLDMKMRLVNDVRCGLSRRRIRPSHQLTASIGN